MPLSRESVVGLRYFFQLEGYSVSAAEATWIMQQHYWQVLLHRFCAFWGEHFLQIRMTKSWPGETYMREILIFHDNAPAHKSTIAHEGVLSLDGKHGDFATHACTLSTSLILFHVFFSCDMPTHTKKALQVAYSPPGRLSDLPFISPCLGTCPPPTKAANMHFCSGLKNSRSVLWLRRKRTSIVVAK